VNTNAKDLPVIESVVVRDLAIGDPQAFPFGDAVSTWNQPTWTQSGASKRRAFRFDAWVSDRLSIWREKRTQIRKENSRKQVLEQTKAKTKGS